MTSIQITSQQLFIHWQAACGAVGGISALGVPGRVSELRTALDRFGENMSRFDPARADGNHVRTLFSTLHRTIVQPAYTCAVAVDPHNRRPETLALQALFSGGQVLLAQRTPKQTTSPAVAGQNTEGLRIDFPIKDKNAQIRYLTLMEVFFSEPRAPASLLERVTRHLPAHKPGVGLKKFENDINRWTEKGLLENKGGRLHLTELGASIVGDVLRRIMLVYLLNHTREEQRWVSAILLMGSRDANLILQRDDANLVRDLAFALGTTF